jgi:hypothetical protein
MPPHFCAVFALPWVLAKKYLHFHFFNIKNKKINDKH